MYYAIEKETSEREQKYEDKDWTCSGALQR